MQLQHHTVLAILACKIRELCISCYMQQFSWNTQCSAAIYLWQRLEHERISLVTQKSHAWSCMQKFQDDPKIVYCRALLEKGASVTCVEDGLPTWVAEVLQYSHIVSLRARSM